MIPVKKSKSILFLSFILLALVCVLKVSTTNVYADTVLKKGGESNHRGEHNYVKWDTHINYSPTCCKTGRQTYKCSRKGCWAYELVSVDKLPHQFSGPRSYIFWKRKPTCYRTGVYKIKCNYCNTLSEWRNKPKKKHNWTDVNLKTRLGKCAYCGIPHKLNSKEYKLYLREIGNFSSGDFTSR